MNPVPQLDFHPDAESLNAFVEQALPERERTQVLAHLTGCSRCRQVVYFAQEEGSEFETANAAQIQAIHTAVRPGLWSGWRMAWIPVAALSAIFAVAFLVHLRRVETPTETARVAPQSGSHDEKSAAKASPNEGAETGKKQSPVAVANAKRAVRSTPPSGQELSKTGLAGAVPSAAQPAVAGAIEPAIPQPGDLAFKPNAFGEGLSAPEATARIEAKKASPLPQPRRFQGALGGNGAADTHTQVRLNNTANHAQSDQTAPVTASSLRLHAAPAPSARFGFTNRTAMAGALAARKVQTDNLPSGLPAVSAATAPHRALAIDPAGILFVSEDSGRHWESVPRQWSGRAVAVRVMQGVHGIAMAPASPGGKDVEQGANGSNFGATDTLAAPGTVFEIVNDRDLVWISPDGRTWKAK